MPKTTNATGNRQWGVIVERLRARVVRELHAFASCSQEVRALLIADSIYALVLPVIEIFVAAYVLHNSQEASKVVACQFAIYLLTPIAFLVNGFLLRRIAVNYMYAAGMFLSGGALFILTIVSIRGWTGLFLCGGMLGLSTGIFWANRGLLAVSVTNDRNRNYFYGVETSTLTLASLAAPWFVGALIEHLRRSDSLAGVNTAYRIVTAISLILTSMAAVLMLRGNYPKPSIGRFVFFRFHPLWYRLLGLAALRGLAQGYILTAPALLILRLVGQEGTLGKIEAIGSCAASICLYVVGRISRPEDRIRTLAWGIFLFLAGAVVNAILFNAIGVLLFMACLLLAKPLIDLAYNPIELRTIDVVARMEERTQYAYVLNHEVGVFAGRFLGCTLFIAIAICLSEESALRYALAIVAVLQIPAIWVARKLPL